MRAGINKGPYLAAVVAGVLLSGAAVADTPFFGNRFDSGTLAVQQKVEELYQDGEYERALFIYENELAPLGDKYAQYMVGFMHLTGTGTSENAVAASAWYRLAAERSYPEFVTVRDQLLKTFTEPDLLHSDAKYLELKRKYSDLVIIEQGIREDLELLEPLTGSRLGGTSQAVTIVKRSGLAVSADQVRARARARIAERLRQLDDLIDGVEVETDVDRLDVDILRDQVRLEIERIDDR